MTTTLPSAIQTSRAMLEASENLDADEYLRHLTEDVVIHPPGFLIGPGELRGHEEVRAGFAKLRDTLGADRRLRLSRRRYFLDREDENKVLVAVEIAICSDSAAAFGEEAALLITFAGQRVSRIESWTNREEGLAQFKDVVEVLAEA